MAEQTRPSVEIYDTTLRDGTQQEGISLTAQDKLVVSRLLDDLGVAYTASRVSVKVRYNVVSEDTSPNSRPLGRQRLDVGTRIAAPRQQQHRLGQHLGPVMDRRPTTGPTHRR